VDLRLQKGQGGKTTRKLNKKDTDLMKVHKKTLNKDSRRKTIKIRQRGGTRGRSGACQSGGRA
jgi:hypothetical protein